MSINQWQLSRGTDIGIRNMVVINTTSFHGLTLYIPVKLNTTEDEKALFGMRSMVIEKQARLPT